MELDTRLPGLRLPTAARPVFVICFLIALVDGYDTLMLSFIAPLIAREWAMPASSVGQLFASGFAGAALGAVAMGAAADRFGRRRMLLLALAVAGGFTLLCAVARSPLQVMVLRFVSGIGLGGAIPAMSALVAEHADAERRGAVVTRTFLGFPIGAMVGGAATAAVMLSIGWRGVFLGAGVLVLALLPAVAWVVRETPRDPHRQGRNGGKESHGKASFGNLAHEGRAAGTLLLCAAVFCILLGSYFLLSWTPTVLTLNGMGPQRAALAAVVLNLGGVVGALAASAFIKGRSPFVPVAACLGLGALLVPLLGWHVLAGSALVFALVFLIGMLVIGGQINIPAVAVHFYPSPVRAAGVGLAMAVGRLGSIAGPLAGGYLVAAQLAWDRLFLLAALPPLVAALAMAAVALTTRTHSSSNGDRMHRPP